MVLRCGKFLPALNEYSTFKVGRIWSLIIKYLLPIVLIGMWVVGIISLFRTANQFEIIVDLIIIVAVMVTAVVLTKLKPVRE